MVSRLECNYPVFCNHRVLILVAILVCRLYRKLTATLALVEEGIKPILSVLSIISRITRDSLYKENVQKQGKTEGDENE